MYSELNNPNLYVQVDEQVVEETSESLVETIPDPSPSLSQADPVRPSRSTALASREQIRALAREGRL